MMMHGLAEVKFALYVGSLITYSLHHAKRNF